MLTISFVATSLIIAFGISFAIIMGYYHSLKMKQNKFESKKNTEIDIVDELDDIKIICK